MFGISGTELVIILFFGFLIFGPEKLPQMGRTVGRAIRQFRNASEAANKKFREEVADPFQEAIAPYRDQVEETAKPLKEDIAAINSTLNETKSMFTDPFKDMLSPTQATPKAPTGTAIAGGTAVDERETTTTPEDPFAEVLGGEDAVEGKTEPREPQKKSMASTLYGLEDEEGGE